MGTAPVAVPRGARGREVGAVRAATEPEPGDPVYAALKRWRLERAKADGVPAYVVFHNSTLAEVAARRPTTLNELASVPGIGPTKLERYGEDVMAAISAP